jgi:hypothetical protein
LSIAAAAPLSPQELVLRLAHCAAPDFRTADLESEHGNGGFALQLVSDRHWLELAGRTSFSLLRPGDGRPVATVRIDLPPPGQFAQQQRWREHALLDAAARSDAHLRQLDLPSGERLSTLNERGIGDAYPGGKYAGISVLSLPAAGLFVQGRWTRLEGYGDTRDLDAVQAAVWRNVLPCVRLAGAD